MKHVWSNSMPVGTRGWLSAMLIVCVVGVWLLRGAAHGEHATPETGSATASIEDYYNEHVQTKIYYTTGDRDVTVNLEVGVHDTTLSQTPELDGIVFQYVISCPNPKRPASFVLTQGCYDQVEFTKRLGFRSLVHDVFELNELTPGESRLQLDVYAAYPGSENVSTLVDSYLLSMPQDLYKQSCDQSEVAR